MIIPVSLNTVDDRVCSRSCNDCDSIWNVRDICQDEFPQKREICQKCFFSWLVLVAQQNPESLLKKVAGNNLSLHSCCTEHDEVKSHMITLIADTEDLS